MLNNVSIIPMFTDKDLYGWLRELMQELVTIEATAVSTLAAAASTTITHSTAESRLVQVFKSTGEKCTDAEMAITLASTTTVTITNNSGSDLANLTVNILIK